MTAGPAEPRRLLVEHPATDADGAIIDGVALVTLDRPEVLNALDGEMLRQLVVVLQRLDAEPTCRAVVITGRGERAFAAGADINEMVDATPEELEASGRFRAWDDLRAIGVPLIAAVRGYALGGGCELAMTCDIVVAADDATFGQPEIRIGVMPGAGGTQRLTRALGKARAMELILTGDTLGAREAEARGLVSRVVAREETVPEALALAGRIAALPPLAVRAAKASVNRAFDVSLTEGLRAERADFFGLFATEDQQEGMHAFMEKRAPSWRGR
ncbi:MAG TPA: enoyl-CoA hydratase-related protein [Candidatus Sulfotelmatobacter sp.]|nr:enoyl-CoA hydratase-related protein [Candidatus Sulfotelmatobacter sp.]